MHCELTADEIEAVAKGGPLWDIVTEAVHVSLENEVEQALSPDIGGEDRAYCAGRAAAIRDLAGSLQVLRENARLHLEAGGG